VLCQLSYTRFFQCSASDNYRESYTLLNFATANIAIHSKLPKNPEKLSTGFCTKKIHQFPDGILAEREGFEPPEPLSSTVFKTAAIDHSAISPGATKVEFFFNPEKPIR
jgi:hypothetical protein